jgi:hypothetical protein
VAPELTHWQAMVVFAAIVSLAFAFLNKTGGRERLRYAAWTFFAFLVIAIAAGWVMFWLAR